MQFIHWKKRAVLLLMVGLLATTLIVPVHAQEISDETLTESASDFFDPTDIPPEEFYRAKVIEVLKEDTVEISPGIVEEIQLVLAEILNGKEKGNHITTTNGGVVTIDDYQKVSPGDTIVLIKIYTVDGGADYYVHDHFRLWPLTIIFLIFVVLAIFFARRKGVGAIVGLIFSIWILVAFIVPKIIDGGDPLVITSIGVTIIATVSLFIAHGFTKRTAIALLSTLVTLAIALGFSQWFVEFASLFGKGSEDAFFLQMGNLAHINLRGLLLAGIVIGTLGVLDDITTAQTAVVGELRQANPNLSKKELYRRGLIVGREHIASLVNTLVLAYAGASLPLFILFSVNEHVPLWLTLNGELVAEEFIRTIIGSIALILAVPITTLFAAHFLQNEKTRKVPAANHKH